MTVGTACPDRLGTALPAASAPAPAPAREGAVLAIVADAVARVLDVDPVTVIMATHLEYELGADSIALVEIVELTEARVRTLLDPVFVVADHDLDGLVTVGALVRYVLLRAHA